MTKLITHEATSGTTKQCRSETPVTLWSYSARLALLMLCRCTAVVVGVCASTLGRVTRGRLVTLLFIWRRLAILRLVVSLALLVVWRCLAVLRLAVALLVLAIWRRLAIWRLAVALLAL